jgi:hypothetical protein
LTRPAALEPPLRGQSNRTAINDDSDAAIRADGTASVVEGLYHHQIYIQKQMFVLFLIS